MSAEPFSRLAVVGLGLLGGSAALAARERGAAAEVRGVDPGLRKAAGIELVSLAEAARWADLVLLAVPIEVMEEVLKGIAPELGSETLVTDLASVKAPMAEMARRVLPNPQNCVGAHPMTGGHESGFARARPDLFAGAPCIITPEGHEPAEVVDRIEEFWQCLGAVTVRRAPQEHDAITAVLSHVPHVIAYAFARGMPERDVLRLAGPGLRDFIRIARANPELWCEILLRNRCKVAEGLARFERDLAGLKDALVRGDRAALERALREGQAKAQNVDGSGD
ncbi:MAG: prephenate dehydrogenase [Myxococcota bacterium]